MERVANTIPYHDEVHVANKILGDLSDTKPVDLSKLMEANKAWLQAIDGIFSKMH